MGDDQTHNLDTKACLQHNLRSLPPQIITHLQFQPDSHKFDIISVFLASYLTYIVCILSLAYRSIEPESPRVLRGAVQHMGARVHASLPLWDALLHSRLRA